MKTADAVKKSMATIKTDQDVRDAVINHEATLSALGGRITGVEEGLKTVHADISGIKGDMSVGFASITSEIRESKASQGPRLGEMLKYVAIGGGVIGMSAAAITVLVTSFVSPEITGLKTHSAAYQRDFEARIDEARQELTSFRNKERERLRADLDGLRSEIGGLRDKLSWLGKVDRP